MFIYIIVCHWKLLVSVWQWHLNAGTVGANVTPVENNHSGKQLRPELLSVLSSMESKVEDGVEKDENEWTVSITVVGASGDLAKKKIFPALFALYYEGCLPKVRYCYIVVLFLFCIFWKLVMCMYLGLNCLFISWQHFTICGYARSKMTDAELRNMVSKTLTCRIDKR